MSAFDPIKAVTLHSQVTVDSDIGLRYGAESQGLLVKGVSYKPTRDVKKKYNHRGHKVMNIQTNPEMVLGFDAEVLQLSGTLAALAPGEPINKSNVQEFYSGIGHGFNTAGTGYFIAGGIDTGAAPGDLFAAKFDLEWFPLPDTTTNLVTAP